VAIPNLPFAPSVIQGIPQPKGNTIGVLSQFISQVRNGARGFRVRERRQSVRLEQGSRQGIETIAASTASPGPGHSSPPKSNSFNCLGLGQ
jgi:hypothetical protein